MTTLLIILAVIAYLVVGQIVIGLVAYLFNEYPDPIIMLWSTITWPVALLVGLVIFGCERLRDIGPNSIAWHVYAWLKRRKG